MDEDLMDIPQDEGVNMYSNSSSTSLESLQSTNINGECNNSTDERECGPESKDDTEVVVDDSISCLKFHAKNIVFLSISPSSRWLAAGSEVIRVIIHEKLLKVRILTTADANINVYLILNFLAKVLKVLFLSLFLP